MSDIVHLNIRVFGRVQGVWFRRSAQLEAQRLGVSGSARNESDGSVYIEAEGSEEQLELFLKWCHRGPELAQVSRIEEKSGKVIDIEGFEVN